MRTPGGLLVLALCLPAAAQDRPELPAVPGPALRLTHAGAHAPVMSLAFAPDGATLYVGGLDKVARAYALRDGKFVAAGPLRPPLGPGNAGAVNAVAVSPDGRWVAVAGRGPMRFEAGFGQDGLDIDTKQIPDVMRRDLGLIYVFDRANPKGGKLLRGHKGEVRALAFADPAPADGPVLVSAALERDGTDKADGVLRAWDVAGAKELAAKAGLPGWRTLPRLAAWPTGDKLTVRAAVAWPEEDEKQQGSLRVWNTGSGELRPLPDGAFNTALAVRHAKDGSAAVVVSGGFWNEGVPGRPVLGRLVARPLDGSDERVIPFPREGNTHFLPVAVAPAGDALVVLIQPTTAAPAGERAAELRVAAANGDTLQRLPLKGVALEGLPVLVTSRSGRHVALSGFTDRRVEVYDVAALAAGKADPQVIPGEPGGFAAVSFLEGNKLWLGAAGQKPDRGGEVFDFVARKSAPNDGTATPDAPTTDARFEFVADRKPARVVVRVGAKPIECVLRDTEQPTAAAYLPAGPPWAKDRGAVVAVAHTQPDSLVTLVSLFDADGRRVRQLIGPEQPVRALAFSGKRPLLAAVGGDRVASVWSLRDLDKALGAVEGLRVADVGNQVRVQAVEKADLGVAVGDVIEGFTAPAGKVVPVKTAVEFLWSVRARPVGRPVSVRVAGKDVALPVGRAVEQRGPLFALWVAPGGGADWVGWNPAGPYDAGSPAAEARIGWQTATGDPTAPVAFAGADQYRKQNYRKDVLKFLLARADLGPGLEDQADAYPPPPPTLRTEFVGAEQRGGLAVLRDPKAKLLVQLNDDTGDFPFAKAVLRWRATAVGGVPMPWQEVRLAGQERTVELDLSGHKWVRGRHAVEVAVHRTPTSPVGVQATPEAEFVPPPPLVTALVGGKEVPDRGTVKTDDEKVVVGARVVAADGAVAGVTWFAPDAQWADVPLPLKDGAEYGPAELTLKPGRTKLRVAARNRGAPEADRREAKFVDIEVEYTKPKEIAAPRLSGLAPTPAAEAGVVNGRPVLVTSTAKVSLTADIDSAEPLTAVEWDDGDGAWVPVTLDPAGPRKATVSRVVALASDKPRTVRVRAKSDRSPFAESAAELVFHPALPTVGVAAAPTVPVTAPEFVLSGTVPAASGAKVAVVVASAGGKERRFDADVDAAGGWRAAVSLDPGENRLALVVRNDWREATRAGVAVVTYRRPPRVVRVAPVDAGEQGVADVVVTAAAADGLPPTSVVVNGRPVAIDPPKPAGTRPGELWWEIKAPAVPISADVTELQVTARNADGDGERVPVPVARKKAALLPPVLALADGAQDRATAKPRLDLGFKVTSPTPLVRVQVWHAERTGAEFALVESVDLKAAEAVAGGYALTASVGVDLRTGPNHVRVTAVNGGGETKAEFAVGYTPAGALVRIVAVEELKADGTPRRLARTADGFAEAAGGLVTVRGVVTWPGDDPAAADTGLSAVLFANQVGHLPVPVGPAAADGSRPFSATVFLNDADTRVRVELRTVGQDAALPQQVGSAEVRVPCREPVTEQRLHVVVVGVDVPDADRAGLAASVVTALGGSVPADRAGQFDGGEFNLGAFKSAVMYPPVMEEVTEGKVAFALERVGREVRRLSTGRDRWLNDVVLLYYQGKDWVADDGRRWLHTTRSQVYSERAATNLAVRLEGLPSTPGVRLLLLNVAGPGKAGDAVAVGPPLLRYGWSEAASAGQLFPLLRQAMAAQQTIGGVVGDVRAAHAAAPGRAGEPIEVLPAELRVRRISKGGK